MMPATLLSRFVPAADPRRAMLGGLFDDLVPRMENSSGQGALPPLRVSPQSPVEAKKPQTLGVKEALALAAEASNAPSPELPSLGGQVIAGNSAPLLALVQMFPGYGRYFGGNR